MSRLAPPHALAAGISGGRTASGRRPRRPARFVLAAALALAAGLAALAPAGPAAAQGVRAASRQETRDDVASRLQGMRGTLQPRQGGVIGLMGYNVIPDNSTDALQFDATTLTGENDKTLTLYQGGFGFTISDDFPLYLEIYAGYARYDPRLYFAGEAPGNSVARWNNFTATLGVGWDFRIAENLWLRPIINAAGGYAASDLSLFVDFVEYRRNTTFSQLPDAHVNVWGGGGSLMLAYYDYRPERDIDVELRYTQIHLQTFGDTVQAARGSSTAKTAGIWARYRWPTGREAFGRPIRWVVQGAGSLYLGGQREAIGFDWSTKFGGGIEFDVGRWEFGAMGLTVSRVRLMAQYFYGARDITGGSIGIGMSF